MKKCEKCEVKIKNKK